MIEEVMKNIISSNNLLYFENRRVFNGINTNYSNIKELHRR
jgi:hypothetical protein